METNKKKKKIPQLSSGDAALEGGKRITASKGEDLESFEGSENSCKSQPRGKSGAKEKKVTLQIKIFSYATEKQLRFSANLNTGVKVIRNHGETSKVDEIKGIKNKKPRTRNIIKILKTKKKNYTINKPS